MSDARGWAQAKELIAREREARTGELDLGDLGLTELPEELFELEHLEVLNLDECFRGVNGDWRLSAGRFAENRIATLAPRFARLRKLRRLFLKCVEAKDVTLLGHLDRLTHLAFGGLQVSDLEPLSKLTSLQYLDCQRTQVSDLEPLSKLTSLQSLDCNLTEVSDLEPLSKLTSLQSLTCHVTEVSDLEPLSKLTSLQSLTCSGTQVSDLEPLSKLTSLQYLDCSGTQVSGLEPLSKLTSLQYLDCSGTQVSGLEPLSKLTSLQSLSCYRTQVSDLEPLSKLTSLQSLSCSYTRVSDLSALLAVDALTTLCANGCKLDCLPPTLIPGASLERLFLHRSRLPELPPELLSTEWYDNCLEGVRAHLRDLEAGAEPVRDCKLIVLGNGRVGKTQICRRLRDEDFDESIPSTHGIQVATVEFGQTADLNVWDFGGQDIYHGTHALFSRTRALFLIAWNSASETMQEYEHEGLAFRNHPLAYWLDYVRYLGGPQSAVLVVQTQCDTPAQTRKLPPVDEQRLDFPYCIPVNYSAKNNRGRASLDEAIADGIAYLRERDGIASYGRGRAEVIRRLRQWQAEDAARPRQQRVHRTLARSEFEALCREVGGISSSQALLRYLHDAGVVFADERHFGANIILDQSWALDAVYALFDRQSAYRHLRHLRGRFTRSLLGPLAWQEYSEAEQRLFLDLMLACGICFEIRKADPERELEAEYAAPDALPTRAEVRADLDERSWTDDAPTLLVRFEFEFLHFGVIRSLIAKIGSQALGAGVYWRTGVWVREARSSATAIIEEQRHQGDAGGSIVLCVQGRDRESLARRLVAVIREVHDCREAPMHVELDNEPLDEPRARALLDPQRHEHDEPKQAAPPLEFIHEPPKPKPSPQVFVSYAWADGAEHVDQLCTVLANQGLEVFRDATHAELGSRISAFMRRLVAGDYILVVLSARYLRSPNCMTELFEIYRGCGDDPARFLSRVIPIVLPNAQISALEQRFEQALHWTAQRDKLEGMVKQLGAVNLGTDSMRQYQRIHDFARHVTEMLTLVNDRLVPRDFERMRKEGFRELMILMNFRPESN